MRLSQPCSSIDSPKQCDLHFIACKKTTRHLLLIMCNVKYLDFHLIDDALLNRDNYDLHIFLVSGDWISTFGMHFSYIYHLLVRLWYRLNFVLSLKRWIAYIHFWAVFDCVDHAVLRYTNPECFYIDFARDFIEKFTLGIYWPSAKKGFFTQCYQLPVKTKCSYVQ